jgi:hypothetical protein
MTWGVIHWRILGASTTIPRRNDWAGCDRCKEGTCRPEAADVLPKVMNLLEGDPEAHVRAMAIEVVGQFVHTNAVAAAAISAAQ